MHFHVRHLGRTRQQVFGKGGRDRLRGAVVSHQLEERIADAVRHAAHDLSLRDHGIDDAPAIVDHDIAQDAYAAGLDIHLDLDRVTGSAVGEGARLKALHAFEPGVELARH